jgi:predicted ester cyclase
VQNREQRTETKERDQESHKHSIDWLCGCQPAGTNSFGKAPRGQEAVPSTQEAKHLATLKSSDFEFYNRQRWGRLGEVYDKNLEVTYSDGRVIKSLDAYVEDLRIRNDFAPDAHIGSHLISFGSGEWTALMRTSRGTFTRPLANAQGKAQLSPNGKKFQSVEAVVSHWQDGVIDRQFHFWDSGTIGQQIGAAPHMGAGDADQDLPAVFPSIGYAQPPYVIAKRLFALDEMDFDVFSLSQIARLSESHAQDVLCMWPDGRLEKGIEPHLATMIELLTFSRDLIIDLHPIRFGAGEWTVLIGEMHGTFSGLMSNPAGGEPIKPTGKPFRMKMATFSHWRGGLMDGEYLVWDNAAFMRQMGVM